MKNIYVISPSGKFYGSEQVLFDFLKTTEQRYHVFAPQGMFYDKLIEQGKHHIHQFSSVNKMYLRIMLDMLVGRCDGVYINEGGHSRYIRFLSQLFPHKRFFIHVRLLEDCAMNRLGTKRPNIEYISVSQYITEEVKKNTGIDCHTIHDLYVPTQKMTYRPVPDSDVIRAGIVGRVTDTKGLADVVSFCRYVEGLSELPKKLELHFYGAINEQSELATSFVNESASYKKVKCVFHGFVNDKELIYRGG